MNKGFVKDVLRRLYHLSPAKIVGKYRGKKSSLMTDGLKHITISVPELFFHHNTDKGFARYDMIVRLLAVENYYGKNDFGFDFYRRMQSARINKDWVEPAIERFTELIKSYDENGYDSKSEIEIDSNLHLLDGSHRMAMAIFHNCNSINAVLRSYVENVFYGIEWFKINGFTEDECIVLTNKYKEIHKRYQQPFVCTIWHPAYPFFDEITNHLSLFGTIIETKDFELSEENYKYYTRGIYSVDDIAKWKIEKKIDYMMSKQTDVYHLRMVVMKLEDPDFRLKDSTYGTLSKRCELIKQLIRDSYKTKVENYYHDVIIHIGDNFFQNNFIHRFLTVPRIDVKNILDRIIQFNYVIAKTEVDYMPKDFPTHYPLGKDIDIIAADIDNYKKIKESIINSSSTYNHLYDIRNLETENDSRFLLRFELNNQLILQFDLSYIINDTSCDFTNEICNDHLTISNYYIATKEKEILLRLCECYHNPSKVHHFTYVKNNLIFLNEELCNKCLVFDWKKLINNIK